MSTTKNVSKTHRETKTVTQTASTSQNILDLFQLDENIIDKLKINRLEDGVHICVRLKQQYVVCPSCRAKTNKIKDYRTKSIKHSVLINNQCFIDYEARRYTCRRCNKVFYENNPFTMPSSRMSIATVYNVLNDLKSPQETFTNISKRYGISPTTVSSMFDRHIMISRRTLPVYLCLDETYAFKSHDSPYICVLLDYTNQKIVDVLPSRKKHDLITYFTSIPRDERLKVKVVSFDMWETYRIVSQIVFPNAVCAVDRFHVMQELYRKVDRIRLETMRKVKHKKDTLRAKQLLLKNENKKLSPAEHLELEDASKYYYVLKKFNWMIFKNQGKQFDPNVEKRYNRVLQIYANYYDLYTYMVRIDPQLDVAAMFKDEISSLYRDCTIETAPEKLDEIISGLKDSNIPSMVEFSKTLVRWRREIINSFTIVDEEKNRRISNGLIENRNKAIKTIKHNANGYLNWERFRNRILYCLNDDTTFHMTPINKKEH